MPKLESLAHGDQPRRGRSRRVTTSLAEINVVPLVDVMLVLLVIFMVTAPMLQRGLDVNLPIATRAQQISEERLFINVPLAYRSNHIVYIGEDPVRVEILDERIRQAMLNKTNKQVFLRGDGGVRLQDLMDVMDKLKAGGVERVGIVTKLPQER
jgi:biopolymer transport protein ExbD